MKVILSYTSVKAKSKQNISVQMAPVMNCFRTTLLRIVDLISSFMNSPMMPKRFKYDISVDFTF